MRLIFLYKFLREKLQNILIISPISIAGELILKGFYEGFLKLGHKVDFVDVRELKNYESKNEPDFILCYDYGYLILQDAFLKVKKFLEKNKNLKLIHYFADDPFSNYALSFDDSLIQAFKSLLLDCSNNIELYFWDEKFLNSFSEKEGKFFPLCVNCDKYKDWDLEKKYDITFVGRPLGGNREEILAQVVKQFKNKLKIFSYPKHFEKSVELMKKFLNEEELKCYKECFSGYICEQEELSRIYNSSKINLNINLQGENSLNFRTFEVLSSKGFLLQDKRGDVQKLGLFDALVEYDDKKDLIEKITYYLDKRDEREKIALRARKLTCEHYNILSRAGEILNIVE